MKTSALKNWSSIPGNQGAVPRKSKNVIDARNTTGKHLFRTESQTQEAFNPKQKRKSQRNTNANQNRLAGATSGPMKGLGDQVRKRRVELLTSPGKATERLGAFKKTTPSKKQDRLKKARGK